MRLLLFISLALPFKLAVNITEKKFVVWRQLCVDVFLIGHDG